MPDGSAEKREHGELSPLQSIPYRLSEAWAFAEEQSANLALLRARQAVYEFRSHQECVFLPEMSKLRSPSLGRVGRVLL